jgi:hypothetical protein
MFIGSISFIKNNLINEESGELEKKINYQLIEKEYLCNNKCIDLLTESLIFQNHLAFFFFFLQEWEDLMILTYASEGALQMEFDTVER